MSKKFVFVVLNVEEERCVGVDFFDDEEKMRRQARMAREDFGEGFIVIEHPSAGDAYASTMASVLGELEARNRAADVQFASRSPN